jgi:hypothetical protein
MSMRLSLLACTPFLVLSRLIHTRTTSMAQVSSTFDLDEWMRQLKVLTATWTAVDLCFNFSRKDATLEPQDLAYAQAIEDLLIQGYDQGQRIACFRQPREQMGWYNSLVRFYVTTRRVPQFFTDDSKIPGMFSHNLSTAWLLITWRNQPYLLVSLLRKCHANITTIAA